MHVSTRSRYGLRAMLYLALHDDGRPVPLSQIASSEGLPAPFLERIAGGLRKGGLVTASRGVAGGYRLARPAASITAADIVVALDGPLDVLACVHDQGACERANGCMSRAVWARLDDAITAALAGVTLKDLMEARTQ